jgi:hypothetical protein
MYAGEFFYVIYLFHTKLIFPWMQGDLNKSNVRIYLLDTSENSNFRPNLSEDLQQCPSGLHEGDVECIGHRLNRTEVSLAMPDAEICPLPRVVPPGLHEGDAECNGHRINRTEVSLAMPDAEICPLSHVVPSGLHEGDVECIGHRLNITEVSPAMPDAEICRFPM